MTLLPQPFRYLGPAAAALAVTALLVACNSDSSKNGAAPLEPYTGQVTTSENYTMPTLIPDGKGGYTLAPITDGVMPALPSARVASSSRNSDVDESALPEKVQVGDLVSVHWKMYSLRTGVLVESTDDGVSEVPSFVLGGGKGGNVDALPSAVHDALIDMRVGDTVQVLFSYGMHDLPFVFEADDAYTLMVNIIAKS